MPIPTIIFDDGRGQLAPLTDLRAAFDIRTGALTTIDRLSRLPHVEVVGLRVPPHLASITRERHAIPVNADVAATEHVLLLSGRCTLPLSQIEGLRPGETLVERSSGDLVAALARGDQVTPMLAQVGPTEGPSVALEGQVLLSRPWHVRAFRDRAIMHDLSLLCGDAGAGATPPSGTVVFGDEELSIAPTASILPTATFDTTHGPIVIDAHATIRHGAIVAGPAYIGPHSTVLDRCLIKPSTAIGPHCKVAGEIGGTIFQGFANKAHDGHLGDSYVGEWANLGAGTTNSNLLNTYGEIICRPLTEAGKPGPNERTGEQFLGATIGDHCKFAICTRIMTGAIVGTGTMWAATAPVSGTVAPFSWVTDGEPRRFALGKFYEVARAVMGRRKIVPSEAYLRRLAETHAATS